MGMSGVAEAAGKPPAPEAAQNSVGKAGRNLKRLEMSQGSRKTRQVILVRSQGTTPVTVRGKAGTGEIETGSQRAL